MLLREENQIGAPYAPSQSTSSLLITIRSIVGQYLAQGLLVGVVDDFIDDNATDK